MVSGHGDGGSDSRAQAFTLEGVIGSAVLLTAILFATEAVIITPTTSGSVDPSVRSEIQAEADDILTVVDQNRTFDLNDYIRYWSADQHRFAGATSRETGYRNENPPKHLGVLLERTVESRGRTYNIRVRYLNTSNQTKSLPMVIRGEPADNAVTATHRVTLYDNQTLTAPNATGVQLHEIDSNRTDGKEGFFYPIPNAIDGPVYNVVEVRIVVW